MTDNSALKALADNGVSIWLDDLSRERLTSGNLQEVIDTKGVVGVTTQVLASISAPGFVTGRTPNVNDLPALAAVTQPAIDALRAQGINKIILSSHLQQYQLESSLAPLLSGIDIIVSGGSGALFADSNDVLQPGATPAQTYPLQLADRDGNPVLQVNTADEYAYVGRLVVGFDDNGNVVREETGVGGSGAYAATDAAVSGLWGAADPYAAGTRGGTVRSLTSAIDAVIASCRRRGLTGFET